LFITYTCIYSTVSNSAYAQDMVSRFTLDSATEFLFGNDVRSLSAGLPYPHTSPLVATYDRSHPANVFAHAFANAQELASRRSRFGSAWPLKEFWKDKVKIQRDIINKFIDPILAEAIAKKRPMKETTGMQDGEREVKDGETLLDHLVNYTEGRSIGYLVAHIMTWYAIPPDPNVLKDETMNIIIAGRMCHHPCKHHCIVLTIIKSRRYSK
jgi:hypothetical protein